MFIKFRIKNSNYDDICEVSAKNAFRALQHVLGFRKKSGIKFISGTGLKDKPCLYRVSENNKVNTYIVTIIEE